MAKKTFDQERHYLDWRLIVKAAARVFLENIHDALTPHCTQPTADSDQWGFSSKLRKQLRKRVRAHWCDLSGCDETWFPYSKDQVVRLYMRFRKRNEKWLEAVPRLLDARPGELEPVELAFPDED